MKKYLLIVIALTFVLVSVKTFAQTNFVPGYIIKKFNGDTIKGELDDRNWESNPSKVTFRQSGGGAETTYTINEIIAFGTDEESYKQFTVDMNVGTKNINQMEPNVMPINVKDSTVFLHLLIKSDYDLYLFHDKLAVDHLYIVDHEGKAKELIHQKALIERGGGSYVAELNTFREQLIGLLNPKPSLAAKINTVLFGTTNIVRIFEKHNEEISNPNKIVRRNTPLEFDVLVGFNTINPSFSGGGNVLSLPYKFKNSFSPTIGVALTYYLPRNRKQFSIDNQLIYSSYSTVSEGSYKIDEFHNVSDLRIMASYIKMVNLLRYQYPNGLIKPFIGLGISNGFAINVDYNYYSENTVVASHSGRLPFFNEFRKYEQALVFALGANYRKFKFDLRNDRSNGVSPYSGVKSSINYYQFLIRYTIK
ncbi:hypothetical protein [Solitalea lacus]|uniref:hypothetical protein n=1 Tax=Solitalea lacus TaxID=2911172 RepID=UPI001EDBFD42|nr:hypothetical protein [Solitalea lacus]UKJ06320.1 hypothetical protein L2B55_12315 [Solitalea lacus]